MSKLGETLNQILTDLKYAKRRQDKCKMDALLFELQSHTYDLFRHIIQPYLRNKEDAHIVLLNTYERVFMYVESFNIFKDGLRWFYQIAKTQMYQFLKEFANRNSVALQDVDYCLAERSFSMSKFIDIIDLRRARKTLSEIDNKILDCCFFKGYTFEKTGKIVGLAKSSVHDRLKDLQAKLEQDRTK